MRITTVAGTVFTLAGMFAAAQTPAVLAKTSGGWVKGTVLADGIQVYRGIPFAAPPVGAWIYGGGFTSGGGGVPLYDGAALARRGVLVVDFNYRVGPFGFLTRPQLAAESPHHSAGNYGLLDQIAALRWIQKNIAGFGGNPAQVTIAGQSAGAISVGMLLRSPLAQGLFARAIMMSGPAVLFDRRLEGDHTLSAAERADAPFAHALGTKSLAAMRQMPAARLLAA